MSESRYLVRLKINGQEIEVAGDKTFVEKKFAQLQNELFGKTKAPEKGEGMHPVRKSIKEKKTLASLLRAAKAKTQADQVLIAGYFLEHELGYANFNIKDLADAFQKAKHRQPKNINDSINGNISKGLIMASGKKDNFKAWVITTEGEDFIQELLKTTKK